MKNLSNRIRTFFYRNQDKGIPNLMLYVVLGSGLVSIMDMILGGEGLLYSYLSFNKARILDGQVWRLFTYIFTENSGNHIFMSLIFLYFFYHLGRRVEMRMGTLRFNAFYLSGILIMDLFAMIFCPTTDVVTAWGTVPAVYFTAFYGNMAWYLHLSILLIFAATNPDAKFLILFFIPVSAWFMGIIYLGLVSMDILQSMVLFPHNLFPLAGLMNFLLFAGKDVRNLLPFLRRRPKPRPAPRQTTGSVPFRKEASPTYTHRCTICGRTDVSDPQLEFRYCSRCNGYFCYCEDHINNHEHVQ